MDSAMQDIYLNIPKTDLKFFRQLAKKMGWTVDTKKSMLKKYIDSRPSNSELSEKDIIEELDKVRYSK